MIYLLLSKIPETHNKNINKSKGVINDLSEGLFQHFWIKPVTTSLTNRVKLVYWFKDSNLHTILGCAVRVILGTLVEIFPPVRTPQGQGRSGLPMEFPPFTEHLSYQNRATSVQLPCNIRVLLGGNPPLLGSNPHKKVYFWGCFGG